MRRKISFLVAVLLVVGGFGVFVWLITSAGGPIKGIVLLSPLFVAALGGFWLWEDFLKPSSRPEAP